MALKAIARAGIDAAAIGDVIMGCVLQGGAGMNVARQASIKAGLPASVPAPASATADAGTLSLSEEYLRSRLS